MMVKNETIKDLGFDVWFGFESIWRVCIAMICIVFLIKFNYQKPSFGWGVFVWFMILWAMRYYFQAIWIIGKAVYKKKRLSDGKE